MAPPTIDKAIELAKQANEVGARNSLSVMKSSKPQSRRTPTKTHPSNKSATSSSSNGNKDQRSSKEPICDICAQNVPGPERENIFAVGKCDHHVCYVCSARLRVICDQSDCPICREKLDTVIFSSIQNRPFVKYDTKECILNEKYKIYFENKAIREAFEKLLKYECLECLKPAKQPQPKKGPPTPTDIHSKVFADVSGLSNHLKSMHKLNLCDLCLTHNKLFPFEYSYYDAAALKKHTKVGEENTPHRGHPSCDLCKNIFFNNDELIQHMSREHFHCHLCGRRDLNMHLYFSDYNSLREHFKAEHMLCERGNCRYEQFTSAFDNQVDYQLHLLQVHGQSTTNPSRGVARHQRTITLDSAPHRARQNSPGRGSRQNYPPNATVVSTGSVAVANSARQPRPESNLFPQARTQRLPTRAEFPTLGNNSNGTGGAGQIASSNSSGPSINSSNYPSLISSTANLSYRVTAGLSGSRGLLVHRMGGGNRLPDQLDEADFPPLPVQPKPKFRKKNRVQTKR